MVSLFHPHRQVWEEHFKWSEDGTELVGLTPIGRATIAALKMNCPQLIRVRRMWVKVGEHPPQFERSFGCCVEKKLRSPSKINQMAE